jgi:hypothetical protein
MGTLGVGTMNSMAFSLLANSSAGIDENQEIEVTIGSLNIFVGSLGLTRLSDPAKSDLSARKPETVIMMESSEGSSSEVNSPVSGGEAQIAGGDEIKLDMEESALKVRNSIRDLTVGGSCVSKSVHQLCAIITEPEEEKTITKETKKSTGKSTKQRSRIGKKKKKSMSQLKSGGSSCQLSIMAQKYRRGQEEKF